MHIITIIEWVTIDGFGIRDNYYEISRYGDIRIKHNKRIMKQFKSRSKNGYYMRINLQTNAGKPKKFNVHRLVAYHFCGIVKYPEKLQVNHIDGNHENNRWHNLEWVTGSENMTHAYKHGLAKTKGESCHLCKFSDNTVHEICKLLELGYKPKEIMTELSLLDVNKYNYTTPEYMSLRSYIKKLRSQTFRKDITLQYKF